MPSEPFVSTEQGAPGCKAGSPPGEQLTHSTVMSEDGRLPIFLNGQRSSGHRLDPSGRKWAGLIRRTHLEQYRIRHTSLVTRADRSDSIHTKDYSFPAGTPIHVIFSGGGLTSVMSIQSVVDAVQDCEGPVRFPPMVSARMDWRSGLFSGQFSSEDYRPRSFAAQFSRNTVTASDTFKDQVGAAVSS
jgi:hypothetical protein